MRKWLPKYIWCRGEEYTELNFISSVTGRGGHEFVVFTAMKINAGTKSSEKLLRPSSQSEI
jgi:hypothetical protein